MGGGKHKSRGEGNNEQKKAQFNKKRFLLQKGPSCSPLTWTRRFNLMQTESSNRPPPPPFGGGGLLICKDGEMSRFLFFFLSCLSVVAMAFVSAAVGRGQEKPKIPNI